MAVVLRTEIPGPKSRALMERRSAAVPRGPYNVTPIFVQSAKGALLTDVDGNTFIDFAGGIGVMNIGHSNPKVVAAIQEQASRFTHTCFHVLPYENYVELAERLNEITPGDFQKKTLLVNSGAEAVENAIKIARAYTGRPAILAYESGFHGRTLLALSLTSKVKPYKKDFGPYAPEIYRVPYPDCYRRPFGDDGRPCGEACADYLEEFFVTHVSPEDVAAVIIEPVLGEGGFVPAPHNYLKRLREITEKYGILFIADEVQTGFGRTGKMFAMDHYPDVIPDLVTMAKSIGGGMPLSAVTGRAEIMDAPMVGGLGGTYGGNPVSNAAALAVIDQMDDKFLERAQQIGEKVANRFKEMYEKYEIIGDARGLGAMQALEFVKDRETKEPYKEAVGAIVKHAYEHGLILISAGTHGNIIRTLMPLVISDEELEEGLDILENAIKSVA